MSMVLSCLSQKLGKAQIVEKEKKPYQGLPVEKNKTCWLLAQQAHHSKSFAVFFITGFLCTTLLTWWAA